MTEVRRAVWATIEKDSETRMLGGGPAAGCPREFVVWRLVCRGADDKLHGYQPKFRTRKAAIERAAEFGIEVRSSPDVAARIPRRRSKR